MKAGAEGSLAELPPGLQDILLDPPLPPVLRELFQFTAFMSHFVFVLLTLGVAMLGVGASLGPPTAPGVAAPMRTPLLRTFFVHKSLAIVLGVGALLLFLVGSPMPLLMGVNGVAPLWLALTPLLLAALVLIELLAEQDGRPRLWARIAGLFGLLCLLLVAGTFSLAVVRAENPEAWGNGSGPARLPPALTLHWILRLAHVYGAALVFGAGFRHLLLRRKGRHDPSVRNLLLAGFAFQVASGILLLLSLPGELGRLGMGYLFIGILLALGLAWRLAAGLMPPLGGRSLALGLLALLGTMLLTRHQHQEQQLEPTEALLARRAAEHRRALLAATGDVRGPLVGGAAHVTRRRDGLSLYDWSCAFCHGGVADGAGEEAPWLDVPPANLAVRRMDEAALHAVLRRGVPGTAMPGFSFYTLDERERLVAFLRETGLRHALEPADPSPAREACVAAEAVFSSLCARCHGHDGGGSPLGRTLVPAPPDLRAQTLSRPAALKLLAEGYPGTLMPEFDHLPTAVREALVDHLHELFEAEGALPR